MYLGVIPISCHNKKIIFGIADQILDYVVKMEQFDNELLFDNLARKGQLKEVLLYEATEIIAAFHKSANSEPDYWDSEDVSNSLHDNFKLLNKFSPSTLDRDLLNELIRRTEVSINLLRELINKRQNTHVRAVHGDLHLKNICIFNGRTHLFDGIEFNPALSNCDVWADLAFLIMDLIFRDRFSDAALVWNHYLLETDDYQGLELLNIYISYRAGVRAKVNCLALEEKLSTEDSENFANDAIKYLKLSLQMLQPTKGRVIAIGGFSGSGKSTLSSLLAKRLQGIHVRSDAVRKHLIGIPLLETAPEDAYSKEMNTKTYDGLLERAQYALNSGRAVIIDATFLSLEKRKEIENFAKNKGVTFNGIWCYVPLEIAQKRMAKRVNSISDANEDILSFQKSYNLGNISWEQIDTSGEIDQCLETILRCLSFENIRNL